MPVRPFTLAARGMFFGRFGSDGEDFRLPALFLGYPGLVRGYDQGSFEPGECGVSPDGSCPAFDRLIGSRVGVLNAECASPAGPLRRQELLRSATDRDGALRRRRHRVGKPTRRLPAPARNGPAASASPRA